MGTINIYETSSSSPISISIASGKNRIKKSQINNLETVHKIVLNNCDVESIDYGGLTVTGYNSDSIVLPIGSSKVIKNLNVSSTGVVGNSKELREFYGDIIINGNGGAAKLFFTDCHLNKAYGELIINNVKTLWLCCGQNDGTIEYSGFNVIDLRNVDFSECTSLSLLNFLKGPCTIILGNCSNDKIGALSASFMNNAPASGRIVVLTTLVPPILKNCSFSDGVPVDAHANTYDWVAKGKIEKIFVPQSALDDYRNNVYVTEENSGTAGTIGRTGWSYYGPNGYKNIIYPYDPETEYLVKYEGDNNHGRKMWLYRQ